MPQAIIDSHNGISFKAEAVPRDGGFEGRYTLAAHADPALGAGGIDSYRPATENLWSTEAEALTYATEAAHHAIEGVRPFVGRSRDD